MKNNHLISGINVFSAKIQDLRWITILPFVCFICAEVLDIYQIKGQIENTSKIIIKEQHKLEANLDQHITVGEYCERASKRNSSLSIDILKNAYQVMNDLSFTEDANWLSNVKTLSKMIKEENYKNSYTEAFKNHKNLISKSLKSSILKNYTNAVLKQEVALRIYSHCYPNGTWGCGGSYIKPLFKKRGDNLELYIYQPDHSNIKATYSVDGAPYARDYIFQPSQSGTYYLDIKEKYVKDLEIKTQSHCVEVVVQ